MTYRVEVHATSVYHVTADRIEDATRKALALEIAGAKPEYSLPATADADVIPLGRQARG